MDRIYFDNAATTPLKREVLEAMMPYFEDKFGNPSSIYSYGRETRMAVEKARKTVSGILNVAPGSVFFTSCGTESTNTVLSSAVHDLGIRHIISSPLEHHATLHTLEYLQKRGEAEIHFLGVGPDGHVNPWELEDLLGRLPANCLVTLMHANNEIGTLLDLQQTSRICRQAGALFHSDMVQTIGHYPLDLTDIPVDFASGSAHKFHGPKGAGILYIRQPSRLEPLLHGGAQERNMRAGTENIYGIVGLSRALEIASGDFVSLEHRINALRMYMARQLEEYFPEIRFNGDLYGQSLYTILNVSFPKSLRSDMILINLDIHGVCASGGSACNSGADLGSHVIKAIRADPDQVPVRFSFSDQNTLQEVDQVIQILGTILTPYKPD